MAEEERVIKKKSVNLPRNNVGVTIGYVLLAILLPPLAVYLDGGSSFSVVANLLLWLFAPFLGVVQGIVYVLRTKAHRSVSQPARYRLWLKYGDGNDMAATVLTGQTTNVTDDGASTVSNHFSGKKRRIGKIHRESSKAAHPRNTITGVNTNPELGIIMWKRLQNHVREKDRQIGNPVLVETTYDEDQLRHMSNVSDAQNATSPGAAPRSYNTLAPPNPRDLIVSEVPTVSSVYSQPSPREGFVDISPPSSPEPGQTRGRDQPRRFRSMRDVSPVDENRGRFKAAARPGSNIPVLRKAPPVLSGQPQPANTQKFWGGKLAPNSKVRWDEYSGEPTSEGKPGQVSPGSYVPPAVERQKMGYHVSISGPQDTTTKHATFGDRSNRVTTKPSPVNTTPQPREPWKGASGRVEIVQPFKTKAAKQGISIPRKSEPQSTEVLMSGAGGSAVDNYRRGPVMNDTPPVAEDPEEFDSIDEPIKPTVPLKVGRNSPPRSLASPTSPHNQLSQAPYSYPSPITPTHAHPSSGNTEQTHYSGVAQQYSTPPNTKVVRKSIEGTPGSTSSRDNGPASRFSWTTYNTSTTYQRSPPPSPPPPLPTVSASPPQPESVASILNRRRPVPHSDLPARKPVASISTNPRGTMTTTITGPPSPRPVSTFSTSTHKALPRPPTEISAADHADILQAQMDDLRLRRSNVNRLLSDLNKQAPPNPLVTDFRRMRLVEQRKKDFMDELAEIKVEEHDVGLRLHRAYKKREREDPNGSDSAIWVRRVTS